FAGIVFVSNAFDIRTQSNSTRAPVQFNPGTPEPLYHWWKETLCNGLVNQHCFHCSTGPGSLHLGIKTYFLRHCQIHIPVNEDMTDPFIMLKYGDSRIFRYSSYKPFSSTRDNEVYDALQFQHLHDGFPFRNIYKRDSTFMNPFRPCNVP